MDDIYAALLAEYEHLVSVENVVWLIKARLKESDLTGRAQNLMKNSFYHFSLGNDFIRENSNINKVKMFLLFG